MSQLDAQVAAASDPELADGLSDPQRRAVVAVLADAAAPLALADLASDLVEREQRRERGWDPAAGGPDYEAIQRRASMLYHRHVPKLVDAGLVEFDADRRVVALAA